jgi:hypothetical protein
MTTCKDRSHLCVLSYNKSKIGHMMICKMPMLHLINNYNKLWQPIAAIVENLHKSNLPHEGPVLSGRLNLSQS